MCSLDGGRKGETDMKSAKRESLNRHERTPDGKLIIDVTAPKVEDLYEFCDKTAPCVKRDLDHGV